MRIRIKTFFNRVQTAGFTLVELLVTISIFALVTGIVMFNQGRFNSTIFLTNLAYDVSLAIRQAQTYGVNVRHFNKNLGPGLDANTFDAPYGVHFNSKDNTHFVMFGDIINDGYLSQNNLDGAPPIEEGDFMSAEHFCSEHYECVRVYVIKNNSYIKEFSVKNSLGGEFVSSANEFDTLDITFERPDPDAVIRFTKNGDEVADIVSATIVFSSTDDPDALRYVNVTSTGQISAARE
ncbi:MAG: prepilin-type N-terminal cleavage/methylation domain-containing protein [Candidatus Paceibacterota bacterium]|jgi:prepilin-type N-terminal cleavage/methylation domain-containing protein